MWNYKPQAAGLAEELKDAFGAETKLVSGSGGAFEVTVDGKLVYSKLETGRFPEPGEVVKIIKS